MRAQDSGHVLSSIWILRVFFQRVRSCSMRVFMCYLHAVISHIIVIINIKRTEPTPEQPCNECAVRAWRTRLLLHRYFFGVSTEREARERERQTEKDMWRYCVSPRLGLFLFSGNNVIHFYLQHIHARMKYHQQQPYPENLARQPKNTQTPIGKSTYIY